MPEPTLVAEGATFIVGKTTLISAVSLEIVPSELVAVIGPNGAGKSTLLNLLSGTVHPTEGAVFVNGSNTTDSALSDLARERSILTQREPADIPFTASQVVEMGRFPHRREESNSHREDVAAIAAAMALTDTAQFADRIYSTLSKGEQTRVSLARVIAQATPIVLLDEPTTALDVAHQERIMRRSAELAAAGKTVVAVLHDLNAAAVHADRIILISEGRVVADGAASEVLRADLLSDVYDQPMAVVDHPFRDCLLVLTAEAAPEV